VGAGFFAPPHYTGIELLARFIPADIYEEIHILAQKYHWSREEILSLPNWERRLYIQKLIRDAERLERELEKEREKFSGGKGFGR